MKPNRHPTPDDTHTVIADCYSRKDANIVARALNFAGAAYL